MNFVQGGISGKWVGRVGDTPIPGCGGYANSIGGASSTGHGESIIKDTVCRQVRSSYYYRAKQSLMILLYCLVIWFLRALF